MIRKIIQRFSKKKLRIDNYGQNLTDTLTHHKTLNKIHTIDPKYKSVLEDPQFQKDSMYRKEYLVNLQRWPDDNEVLIDIEKFNLIEYIKFLFKSKFNDLEEKDQFPYRALQALLLFLTFEIAINTYYYSCKNIYSKYEKEEIKPHYDYKNFERDLRYSVLLFNRSVN